MSAYRSIHQESRHPAQGSARFFLGSVATALAAAIFIASAGISISPTRSDAAPARQLVNRFGKADRLLLPSRLPSADIKLPRGCEPLVSALADAELARLARQCVS